ncbi:MAG TPA: hypothetical protein VGO46_16315 [Gemmatimonadaceae bacterium]|jgi:hypothetical protein|nr:hypothetical protein [Gemmatimonadaceae bacterium]
MTRISFVALLMLASASTVSSQSIFGTPVQFGVMGGRTKPLGDLSNGATNDWNLGGLVLFGAPQSRLRFRLDGQWQRIEGRLSGFALECANCPYYTNRRNMRVLDATANAVFDAAVSGSAKVYFIGGVGVYSARSTLISSLNASYTRESATATRAGINGGVGATFKVGRHDAFIEARVHNLFGSSAFSGDPFYDAYPSNVRMLPINVGFVF